MKSIPIPARDPKFYAEVGDGPARWYAALKEGEIIRMDDEFSIDGRWNPVLKRGPIEPDHPWRRPLAEPPWEEIAECLWMQGDDEGDLHDLWANPTPGARVAVTDDREQAIAWLKALGAPTVISATPEQRCDAIDLAGGDSTQAREAIREMNGQILPLNQDNSTPINEHDQARALHRVVRAMHDGHCPKCGYLAPAEHFQLQKQVSQNVGYGTPPVEFLSLVGHQCPQCNFGMTAAEEDAALAIFRPYFLKSVEVFESWRASR